MEGTCSFHVSKDTIAPKAGCDFHSISGKENLIIRVGPDKGGHWEVIVKDEADHAQNE
jgi:hypothetical protein